MASDSARTDASADKNADNGVDAENDADNGVDTGSTVDPETTGDDERPTGSEDTSGEDTSAEETAPESGDTDVSDDDAQKRPARATAGAGRAQRRQRARAAATAGAGSSAAATAGAGSSAAAASAATTSPASASGSAGATGRPAAANAAQDDAFAEYVVPEIEVMYRVARSLTGNPTDAEDLVQDTLIRAYRSVERFDGRYPRAWLLTIMRNAQMNRVRRKRPELMRDPDLTMQRAADTSQEGQAVEDQVMFDEFDEAVESSLDGLPPKFHDVVRLVDIDGLSYQETADVLDIPVGTVMSRLHRARKRIRTDLAAAGLEPR